MTDRQTTTNQQWEWKEEEEATKLTTLATAMKWEEDAE
jgi:hypothetical protein